MDAKTISRWENGNYMPDMLVGESTADGSVAEDAFESAMEYNQSRRALLAKRYVLYFCIAMLQKGVRL